MNQFLIFLLNFSDYRLGILSIADCVLIVFLVSAIRSGIRMAASKKMATAITLVMFGAILSLLLNILKGYFSVIEYTETFIKLIFYLICVCVIPQYLINQKINIIKWVRIFMYTAVIGGVLQLAIVRVFGVGSWPLYSLGGNWFGISSPTTMLVSNGMIRARSFFTEPAAFAVGITLAFLLLLYREEDKFEWKDHIVYLIGILSANSFSGYGMVALIYVVYFFHVKNYKKFIRMLWLAIPGILAMAGVLTFNRYLRGRLINLFAMKDVSGVVRTIGGFHFLGKIPPYGVGLGNQSLYYHSLTLDASELIWYSGSGEFYNIILVSIITMGYIGGIGLLMYQFYILKKDVRLFLSLIITHFATGRLYSTPLWVFLILYLAMIGTQKQEKWYMKVKRCY